MIKVGLFKWALKRSPWLFHFNASSCNGCDIEILVAITPRLDAERFGVRLVGSPRHADVLVVSGGVNNMSAPRLKRIYEQMPEPKVVVAVGSCACSGGVFSKSFNILGGVDKVIPVDVYVPGCPPRPHAILVGLAKAFTILGERGRR